MTHHIEFSPRHQAVIASGLMCAAYVWKQQNDVYERQQALCEAEQSNDLERRRMAEEALASARQSLVFGVLDFWETTTHAANATPNPITPSELFGAAAEHTREHTQLVS